MNAYLKQDVSTTDAVQITVDGQPMNALAGQTVAAVMLTNGRDSWRTTRAAGRPRGVFCGIGACYDCLVVVNGIPDIRACQRTVAAGDAITTQQGAVLPRPYRPEEEGRESGALQAGGAAEATVTDAAEPGASAGRGVVAEPGELVGSGVVATPGASVGARAAEVLGGAVHSTPILSTPTPTTSKTATPRPPSPPRAVDVAVVGAGPAGIAAALAAADGGAEVLLIDSGQAVGGQFNRQVAEELGVRRPERLQHGWKAFAAKRDRLAAHQRVTHLAEASVWAFEQGQRLWVQRGPADGVGREVFAVDAKSVVLATGAYDRVLPFPGWDLPGVYSAGAAQALAKGQRIAVGKRVIVAGTGPFLLPVAESLVGVGAKVVGLLEANSFQTVRKGWATDPLVASSKVREGLGYGALLAKHRIPLKHGWTVIAAHGEDHVEAVTIARLDDNWHPTKGSERLVEVDAVCLGFGFTAQLELAVSARCELTTGPDGGPAVVVDSDQQTTTPGVFAAGELTGIGGADLAAAEGRVAGAAAARQADQKTAATRADQEKVVKGRRFAAALAKAYPVRDGWRSWSGPETVVCRCEEVTRGDIEGAVVERGAADGRALKLTSRAGLGLCQGRVCSRTVAELAGQYAGPAGQYAGSAGQSDVRRPSEQNDVPRPSMKRPIAAPVRLRDLAEAQEEL